MSHEAMAGARRRHNGQRWVITPPREGMTAWSGPGRAPHPALPTTSAGDRRQPKTRKDRR